MKKPVIILGLLIGFSHFGLAQHNTPGKTLSGKWILISSSEKNINNLLSDQIPDLVFEDSVQHFSGSTGCNRISGTYTINGDQFTFGTLVSTNKACNSMEVENYLSSFLTNVGGFRIENEKLFLYDRIDKNRFLVYKRNNLI